MLTVLGTDWRKAARVARSYNVSHTTISQLAE
jgi:hypothetical protein